MWLISRSRFQNSGSAQICTPLEYSLIYLFNCYTVISVAVNELLPRFLTLSKRPVNCLATDVPQFLAMIDSAEVEEFIALYDCDCANQSHSQPTATGFHKQSDIRCDRPCHARV